MTTLGFEQDPRFYQKSEEIKEHILLTCDIIDFARKSHLENDNLSSSELQLVI